mmetsp:Transcript_19540/g.22144  ORF Transcript_19540/g.22144 Transcript_19540/m.22144 type:complete len:287 (-) Transcript_19540:222-1082(-)
MVKKGDFTVELVNASSKESFKEHKGKDGIDSFVEVEPEAEYFIKVASDSYRRVAFEFIVDGIELVYVTPFAPYQREPQYAGNWSYNNNKSIETSFMFQKIHQSMLQSSSESDDSNIVGEIQVTVYEDIILDGYYQMSSGPMKAKFDSFIPTTEANQDKKKKQVKTTDGKTEISKDDNGSRQNFCRGKKLETFELRYCTALGLIGVGVLPKPPLYEWAKMIRLYKSQSNEKNDRPAKKLKPIIKSTSAILDNEGNTLVKPKRYEFFDLTKEDDENEEHEDNDTFIMI